MTQIYFEFYWGIGLGFKQFEDGIILIILPVLMIMTAKPEENG